MQAVQGCLSCRAFKLCLSAVQVSGEGCGDKRKSVLNITMPRAVGRKSAKSDVSVSRDAMSLPSSFVACA